MTRPIDVWQTPTSRAVDPLRAAHAALTAEAIDRASRDPERQLEVEFRRLSTSWEYLIEVLEQRAHLKKYEVYARAELQGLRGKS